MEKVLAYEFIGKRFDCGSKFGYPGDRRYALTHPNSRTSSSPIFGSLKL
jgi:UTP--glucose-1-phosphate uridylyltransferase